MLQSPCDSPLQDLTGFDFTFAPDSFSMVTCGPMMDAFLLAEAHPQPFCQGLQLALRAYQDPLVAGVPGRGGRLVTLEPECPLSPPAINALAPVRSWFSPLSGA
jgi:hypothetical protein